MPENNPKPTEKNAGAEKGEASWIGKFSDAIRGFLTAVAEARIPPSKMALVPKQGSINLVTGLLGILLFTAAGQIEAATREAALRSQVLMAAIGAVLLFASAIVVIFASRKPQKIVDDWNRTASVFIVVWLLALVVFLILTLPSLLITRETILLDRLVSRLFDAFSNNRVAWREDLAKSMICTFLASLVLLFRTKFADRKFSLAAVGPWVWVLLMTVVVGLVFHISLYVPARL